MLAASHQMARTGIVWTSADVPIFNRGPLDFTFKEVLGV